MECRECGMEMKRLMGTTGWGCLNCGTFYNQYTGLWGMPQELYLDRLEDKDCAEDGE